jgi:methyl-accepting chemotaxis protein
MSSTGVSEGHKPNGHRVQGHVDLEGVKGHATEEALLVSQEILRLVEASKEGRLQERGRASQFSGMYREMVEGINEMLDAILLPIGEGNRILAQISSGKIDELIAATYKGDHEKMKVAVNNVAIVKTGREE